MKKRTVYEKEYSCNSCGKTIIDFELSYSRDARLDLPPCDCKKPYTGIYIYEEPMTEEHKRVWVEYNKTHRPEVSKKLFLDSEERVKSLKPVYVSIMLNTF